MILKMMKSSLTILTFLLFVLFPLFSFGDPINHNENKSVSDQINLKFSVNNTKLKNFDSFLAKCHVANYADHEKKNYSVVFYKTRDLDKHIIGRFDVLGKTDYYNEY